MFKRFTDYPPNTKQFSVLTNGSTAVAGGTPTNIISCRFSKEKIQELLQIKWWDWQEGKILQEIDWLSSKDYGEDREGKI